LHNFSGLNVSENSGFFTFYNWDTPHSTSGFELIYPNPLQRTIGCLYEARPGDPFQRRSNNAKNAAAMTPLMCQLGPKAQGNTHDASRSPV
jgi:hypothetical protein